LALGERLLPQNVEDCPFMKVPLQAEIEPAEEAPRKSVGLVLKVTAVAVLPRLSVKTM
jgi:hypothetical protein